MMPFRIGLDMLWVKEIGITRAISHHYARIKIDSYDSLPLERTLALHTAIILIKAAFNEDQNHYHYNIFLEKCS